MEGHYIKMHVCRLVAFTLLTLTLTGDQICKAGTLNNTEYYAGLKFSSA